jgi:hypothetical protein
MAHAKFRPAQIDEGRIVDTGTMKANDIRRRYLAL